MLRFNLFYTCTRPTTKVETTIVRAHCEAAHVVKKTTQTVKFRITITDITVTADERSASNVHKLPVTPNYPHLHVLH